MIRLAGEADLEAILRVKDEAVANLKADGVNQWQDGYPNAQMFLEDIRHKSLFVYDDGRIQGMCNLSLENDPSYANIYNGEWLSKNKKYLVIHRIAVSNASRGKGIGKAMFQFAIEYAKTNNAISIRIDTHRDNFRMRSLLSKLGFIECGIIYLVNYQNIDNQRIGYEYLITKV